jgi:hypothetical protein
MGLKQYIQRAILFVLNIVLAGGCLELYNPPSSSINYAYLVVDGFLNTGDSTIVQLSRTQTLASTDTPPVVADAAVQIEDDQGGVIVLSSLNNGIYFLPPQTWDPTRNYRIRIGTSGKEYLSDFVPVTQSPPIDSVNFKIVPNGAQLYVNTHDPTNNTHYFRWQYVETWEYSPPVYSYYVYDTGSVVPRTDDIYHCWKTLASTEILIDNSAKLSEDIISEFPLNFIANNDSRFQYKYSTLVKQYALTKDGYDYWTTLLKNTENLGTLFGPQPSQLTGNIHCINVPSEPVLGYFSATSVSEQRIFINNYQIPKGGNFLGYENCTYDTLKLDQVRGYSGGELFVDGAFKGLTQVGWIIGPPGCVDCRLHGGTTTRPNFW